jgi:hypothetical protein
MEQKNNLLKLINTNRYICRRLDHLEVLIPPACLQDQLISKHKTFNLQITKLIGTKFQAK